MHPPSVPASGGGQPPYSSRTPGSTQGDSMTQWQPQYDPRNQRPATPPQWGQGAPPRQDPRGAPQFAPQPQYPPYGYQPQYAPPGAPQVPRKSRKGLFAGLGCGGLAGLFILIAAVAGTSSSSSPPSPSTDQTQAAVPAHSTAAAKAVTVATFSGSGIRNTPPFTVTGTWRLDYKFDCSNFGQAGNFIVMEDGTLTGAMNVNELAFTKAGNSYAYNDAGKHYVEVDTECSWSIKVIDEGS